MEISQKGIDLIKFYEGFSPTTYKCPAGKDTIGYGQSFTPVNIFIDHTITEINAEKLLRFTLIKTEAYLNSVVRVKITQGQFDALCSLVYNWGEGAFGRSNGLKQLNANSYKNAAKEFFSKENGVVKIGGKFSAGLYRRRQAELKLWNEG